MQLLLFQALYMYLRHCNHIEWNSHKLKKRKYVTDENVTVSSK
jgi:hypothetical protein